MSEFKEIELTNIIPSQTNPRTEFDEKSLNELAESIKEYGVLQPIIVRQIPNPKSLQVGKFEVVSGERRFRASKIAKVKTIPASVRELTDDEVFEIQIVENLERKDVHPMDEAVAFKKMLESGKYSMEDIAAKVAKPLTFVAQRLKLNDLIPELKEDFLKGEFGIGHAVLLSRVGEDEQREVFEDSKNEWNLGYPTVKQLKSDLDDEGEDLEKAIFDIEDPDLFVPAGACTTCPKCSLANPILFPEYEEKVCFDSNCFNTKTQVQLRRNLKQIVNDKPGIVLYIRYVSARTKEIISFAESLGKTVYQGWGVVSNANKEDEGALEALDMSDFTYNFVTIKSKDGGSSPKNPNEILKSELSNLKEKAARALELDREKIYTRAIDEIISVPEKNEKLLNGEPLTYEEEIALCCEMLSFNDEEWFKENYDSEGYGWNITRYEAVKNVFSKNFFYTLIRRFIQRELVSRSQTDYERFYKAKSYKAILDHYFPKEIEMFTLEQNDVAAKRIAKSDARISELEKKLAEK